MAKETFNQDIQEWVNEIMQNTRNLSTETELLEQGRVAFKLFLDSDENNDAVLSFNELKKLCEHAGLPMGDDEEEMLNKIDIDHSNTLDIKEWTKWWLNRVSVLPNPLKQQEAIARNTFKLYDSSGDGYLNTSELGVLVTKLGAEFTEAELEEALSEIDEDKSGLIDMEEFVLWWTQRAAGNRNNHSLIALKMRNLAKKASQVFAADPFIAAWNGDLNLMKALIDADKRLAKSTDESDYGGQWTVLQYACYQGHIEIVQILLEVIDTNHINQTNNYGFTALFYAAQRGHMEICKLLLTYHADVTIAGEQISPLIQISASNNPGSSTTEEKEQDATTSSNHNINDKIFMCPIEHILTYPQLKPIFANNEKCIPPNIIPSHKINAEMNISTGVLSFELIGSQKNISYLPIKYWLANIQVVMEQSEIIEDWKNNIPSDLLGDSWIVESIKIPGKLENKMIGANSKLLDQMRTTFEVALDKSFVKKLQFLSILYKIKRMIILEANIYVLEDMWLSLLTSYKQVDASFRGHIDLYESLMNILKNSPDKKNATDLRTNLLYSLESNRTKKMQQKSKKSPSNSKSATPRDIHPHSLSSSSMINNLKNTNITNIPTATTTTFGIVGGGGESMLMQQQQKSSNDVLELIDDINLTIQELKVKANLKNKTLGQSSVNNSTTNSINSTNTNKDKEKTMLLSKQSRRNNTNNTQWMIENIAGKGLFTIKISLAADNIWGKSPKYSEYIIVNILSSNKMKSKLNNSDNVSVSNDNNLIANSNDNVSNDDNNIKNNNSNNNNVIINKIEVIPTKPNQEHEDLHHSNLSSEVNRTGWNDKEKLVTPQVLDPVQNVPGLIPKEQYEVGMKIEGNYQESGEWFPGIISKIHRNGTYSIDYADGDKEKHVHANAIRLLV